MLVGNIICNFSSQVTVNIFVISISAIFIIVFRKNCFLSLTRRICQCIIYSSILYFGKLQKIRCICSVTVSIVKILNIFSVLGIWIICISCVCGICLFTNRIILLFLLSIVTGAGWVFLIVSLYIFCICCRFISVWIYKLFDFFP